MNNKHFLFGIGSLAGALIVSLLPAHSFEKMNGCFVASSNCEAFRSIRKKTNPGHIRLEPGISYPLKGKNKIAATHYQLRIDALKVPDRWVQISCGKVIEHCTAENKKTRAFYKGRKTYKGKRYAGRNGHKTGGNGHYLLAVSWEPAFCESHRGKAECKTMTAQSYDASHLSLHGLWPQPRNNAYCNISVGQKSLDKRHRWNSLEPLKITGETMEILRKVMPGVKSNLQRHEWVKHGSCYKDGSAETYFKDSIALMNELNSSAVKEVFAKNIGKHITTTQIRSAFDKAFGVGSGTKVKVRCDKKGKLVSEIWINLKGSIEQGSSLKTLLAHAKPARNSCQGGVVDPAGYK